MWLISYETDMTLNQVTITRQKWYDKERPTYLKF